MRRLDVSLSRLEGMATDVILLSLPAVERRSTVSYIPLTWREGLINMVAAVRLRWETLQRYAGIKQTLSLLLCGGDGVFAFVLWTVSTLLLYCLSVVIVPRQSVHLVNSRTTCWMPPAVYKVGGSNTVAATVPTSILICCWSCLEFASNVSVLQRLSDHCMLCKWDYKLQYGE
jgi:hypothetical protein